MKKTIVLLTLFPGSFLATNKGYNLIKDQGELDVALEAKDDRMALTPSQEEASERVDSHPDLDKSKREAMLFLLTISRSGGATTVKTA